jgi:hypothetical protein
MRQVYIKWIDAHTYDGWSSIDEAIGALSEPYVCETVGWLIKETEEAYFVCHTKNEIAVCGCINIPKGMVREFCDKG